MTDVFKHHLVGKTVMYRPKDISLISKRKGRNQGFIVSVSVGAATIVVDYADGGPKKSEDVDDFYTLAGEPVSAIYRRGTGQTTQQLLASPQKFYFVVSGWGMMNHARTLVREHVPEKDVEIVSVEGIRQRLVGTNLPVVVDHDVMDRNLVSLHDLQWLQELMSRNNP